MALTSTNNTARNYRLSVSDAIRSSAVYQHQSPVSVQIAFRLYWKSNRSNYSGMINQYDWRGTDNSSYGWQVQYGSSGVQTNIQIKSGGTASDVPHLGSALTASAWNAVYARIDAGNFLLRVDASEATSSWSNSRTLSALNDSTIIYARVDGDPTYDLRLAEMCLWFNQADFTSAQKTALESGHWAYADVPEPDLYIPLERDMLPRITSRNGIFGYYDQAENPPDQFKIVEHPIEVPQEFRYAPGSRLVVPVAYTAEEATAVALDINALDHAHTLDAPNVAAAFALGVDAVAHAHTLDAPVLTTNIAVAVDALAHAHTIDAPSVVINMAVAVDALTHAHALDAPVLAANIALAVDALIHAYAADTPALTVSSPVVATVATAGSILVVPGDARRKPSRAALDRGDPINQGRLRAWPFGEHSGSTVRDVMRGADPLTVHANSEWVTGPLGRGVEVTANDEHTTGITTLTRDAKEWTMLAVFRTSGVIPANYTGIYEHGDNSGGRCGILVVSSEFRYIWGDDRHAQHTGNIPIAINTDYVVALRTTASGVTLNVRNLTTSTSFVGVDLWGLTSQAMPSPVQVGRDSNFATRTFLGIHYLVSTWDRALSDAEIHRLYIEPWAGVAPKRSVHYSIPAATTSQLSVPGDTRRKPSRATLDYSDPINRGLVFATPFDEGSGDSLRDIVKGKVGAVGGAGAAWTQTARGRALDFNEDGYADFGELSDLAFTATDAFSISAWVYADTSTEHQVLISKGGRNIRGWWLSLRANLTRWEFYLTDTFTSATKAVYHNDAPVGEWMHVVATYNGDTAAAATDSMQLYANGAENTGGIYDNGTLSNLTTAEPVVVGASRTSYVNDFSGPMEQVRVWNRTLSAAEVRRLYIEPWAGIAPKRSVYYSAPPPAQTTRISAPTRSKPSRLELDRGDPINHGLRSLLPFQDGVGTAPRDLTGRHTAAFAGSTLPGWIMTDRGMALDVLSSSTNYYVTETFELLEPPFTVAVWMKLSDVSGTYYLWGEGDPAVNNQRHQLSVSAQRLYTATSGGTYSDKSTSARVTTGKWQLAVGVWAATDSRKPYLDGIGPASADTTDLTPAGLTTTHWNANVRLAQNAGISGQLMLGRTWNRALSEAEIRRLYAEPWAGVAPKRTVVYSLPESVPTPSRTDTHRKPSRATLDYSDPINRGLVFATPFDEGSGDSLRDIAKGKVGTRDSNGGGGWVHTSRGRTFDFNDSDSFTFGSPADLQFTPTDPFSISAWIYYDDTNGAGSQHIISYGRLTDRGWSLIMHTAADRLQFNRNDTYPSVAMSVRMQPLAPFQWHHVVATYNGDNAAASTASMAVYANTVNGTIDLFNNGPLTTMTPTVPLRVGGGGITSSDELYSQAEQVRVWNRVLTPFEVRRLYQEPWAGVAPRLYIPTNTPAAIEASGPVALSIESLTHTHTVEAPALAVAYSLSVDGTTHAHTLDAPTLAATVTLSLAALDHAHALDAPGVGVHSSVGTVDALLHAHSLDAPAVVVSNTLAVDALAHAHTLDQPVLVYQLGLVVDALAHTNTLDAPAVNRILGLLVDALTLAHTIDAPTLTYQLGVLVDALLHSHTIDAVDLDSAVVQQALALTAVHRPTATMTGKHLPTSTWTGAVDGSNT